MQSWSNRGPALTPRYTRPAELITMIRTLQLEKDSVLNCYTDSKFVFNSLHVHAHTALWHHRGLLKSSGIPVKNTKLLLQLLDAVLLPKQLAVIHCPAHEAVDTTIKWVNWRADNAAKGVANKTKVLLPVLDNTPPLCEVERDMGNLQAALIPNCQLPEAPCYQPEDQVIVEETKAKKMKSGWYQLDNGKLIIPRILVKTQMHDSGYHAWPTCLRSSL